MEDGETPVVMAPSQTEFSWMTLIQTNKSDGLEVKSGLLGRWLPVSIAVPGSLFVVTGDVLQKATPTLLANTNTNTNTIGGAGAGDRHISRGAFYKAQSYRIRRIPIVSQRDHHHVTLMNMPFVYSRAEATAHATPAVEATVEGVVVEEFTHTHTEQTEQRGSILDAIESMGSFGSGSEEGEEGYEDDYSAVQNEA
jgi:hypothetical protein